MAPWQLLVTFALASAGDPDNVILEFTAEHRCPPCQQMSPIVSRLQRQGYPIEKINVDENQEMSRRFKVQGIPTFVAIVNGNEVRRLEGRRSEGDLKQLCDLIPKEP